MTTLRMGKIFTIMLLLVQCRAVLYDRSVKGSYRYEVGDRVCSMFDEHRHRIELDEYNFPLQPRKQRYGTIAIVLPGICTGERSYVVDWDNKIEIGDRVNLVKGHKIMAGTVTKLVDADTVAVKFDDLRKFVVRDGMCVPDGIRKRSYGGTDATGCENVPKKSLLSIRGKYGKHQKPHKEVTLKFKTKDPFGFTIRPTKNGGGAIVESVQQKLKKVNGYYILRVNGKKKHGNEVHEVHNMHFEGKARYANGMEGAKIWSVTELLRSYRNSQTKSVKITFVNSLEKWEQRDLVLAPFKLGDKVLVRNEREPFLKGTSVEGTIVGVKKVKQEQKRRYMIIGLSSANYEVEIKNIKFGVGTNVKNLAHGYGVVTAIIDDANMEVFFDDIKVGASGYFKNVTKGSLTTTIPSKQGILMQLERPFDVVPDEIEDDW